MKRAALFVCLAFASTGRAQDADIKAALASLHRGETAAARSLARLGAPAVPGVIKALSDEDARIRGIAALALRHIGPAAKDAAPALAEALRDMDISVASEAAQALGAIGPAAAPALAAALKKDASPAVVVRACEAIRILGPAAKECVPTLIATLKKPKDLENVLPVLEALGRIGPAAAPAAGEIVRLLRPEALKEAKAGPLLEDGMRAQAVHTLGRLGPGAKEAVPVLIGIFKDKRSPGDPLGVLSLDALAQIGAASEDLTPFLVEQIERGATPKLVYYRALAQVGAPGKADIAKVAGGMRHKDAWVRLYAAAIVGKVEPNDPAVVSILIESLKEADPKMRRQAAIYVGLVRPRDESVREAIVQATRDMDRTVSAAAKEALEKLK
ncbi:MAG: HEAT repeat domain-containing protein [Gemmataceae bacterium]